MEKLVRIISLDVKENGQHTLVIKCDSRNSLDEIISRLSELIKDIYDDHGKK